MIARRAQLVLLAVTLAACKKSQAELERADRAQLDLILATDGRASAALGEVDKAARRGDYLAAIGILDSRVRPEIDREELTLAGTHPSTDWGRARHDELVKLATERRTSLTPYRAALVARDPERELAATEAELRIEKHAVAVAAAIRGGP